MTDTQSFPINSADLSKALRAVRVPHVASYPLIIVRELRQYTTARGLFTTHLVVDLGRLYNPRYFKVTTAHANGTTMLDTPEISLTRILLLVDNDPCVGQQLVVPEVYPTTRTDIDA